MASTADLKVSNTPAILVIGDGGTGKTRFLASCPKVYIFDFDHGMLSTRDMPAVEYDTFKDDPWSVKPVPPKIIEERKKQGFYPWGTSWTRFIDHLNEKIEPRIASGELVGATIGLDSLTTLSTQSMNYVLKGGGKTGEANPEIQHWGTQLRLLETVMEQLAAWPIRLVVNAHIRRDVNLVMGETEFLPMVAGQLSGRLGIYFDEVYYTYTEGTGKARKFLLRTEANSLFKQAKSRHNVPQGTEAKWSAIAPYFQGGK